MRILPLLLLAACDLSAGEPCSSSGEGFSRTDPCTSECVDREVPCADGSTGEPAVCAGEACTSDEDCEAGWGCAQLDSFDRGCLPLDACPDGYAAP